MGFIYFINQHKQKLLARNYNGYCNSNSEILYRTAGIVSYNNAIKWLQHTDNTEYEKLNAKACTRIKMRVTNRSWMPRRKKKTGHLHLGALGTGN